MEVDVPIDVGRLTRPEADAFRYIAEALGAQFAGDLADSTDTESHVAASPDRETIAPLPHANRAKGSALDVAPADPKAAALLERVAMAERLPFAPKIPPEQMKEVRTLGRQLYHHPWSPESFRYPSNH